MTKMNRPKLVVVLGMHRSGTSALARGLRVLQVEMGDHLIPGEEGRNDRGYWEDADINAFNERLLMRLDSSWHGIANLDKAKFTAPELDDLRAEARTLLEEKLAEHASFGFKDPRTAILLPFWQPIFAQLKLDDLYIISLRNPLDVAASLLKRDAIPLAESFLLWAKYTIAALRYTKGKRRVLVQYDALLEAPEEQLNRIAECLDMPLEGQTNELQIYTREFLSKDLCHSKSSQAALNRSPEVPVFVRQAYDHLRKAAKRQMELDGSSFTKLWTSIENDYLKAEHLYSHIDLLNANNLASRRAVQESEIQSEALRKELSKAYSLAEHESKKLEQALISQGHVEAKKDRAEEQRADALQELQRIQGALKEVSPERENFLAIHVAASVEREQANIQREIAVSEKDRAEQERANALQELHRIQGALKEVSSECDNFLAMRDAANINREQANIQREKAVIEKDRAEQERADALQELHRIQGALKEVSSERDNFLAMRDAAYVERERANIQRENAVIEKDQANIQREKAVIEKDQAEQERADALQELHRIQGALKEVSSERDTILAMHDAANVEREQANIQREKVVTEKEKAEREREDALSKLQPLQQDVQLLQQQLASEMSTRQQLEVDLDSVFSSNSWKVTSPIRAFRSSFFTRPYCFMRRCIYNTLKLIWHRLPIDDTTKRRLKGRLFRALPFFLGRTQAYRAWLEFERTQVRDSHIVASEHGVVEMEAEDRHESMPPPGNFPSTQFTARLIAFYLPQFHPIPENNLWWGKGFTEWTNTAKARPLFPGHEIPSVPSDLGYYDLRVPESRQAQAELAKEYGIEGFCYWHYWFGNGKRLLERPFNEVLESGSPDFPFCLAWANHTWSGIWHGSPDRILIEQTYPGIEDIKMHFYSLLDAFKDDRYIKIDGRNVFCIYRPTDLEHAALFFDTWRELAAKEGAPGFYFIAITDYPWNIPQYGYDACTTNPPVGMLPYQGIKSINEEIEKEMTPGEDGSQLPQIFSYETFVENAFPEVTRHKDFYPCVVPNWDNTPRSGSNGFALHGSTPQLFGRHLGEAVGLVEDRDPDQRVIFVKSWNEWAETNYLEPDVKWGRAFLETTLQTIRDEGK